MLAEKQRPNSEDQQENMSLTEVDPKDVFFTFSRLRPKFSCGRRVEDTLQAIHASELRAEDLPPISVLLDSATGHLFSLNNRRLYVFKALQAEGRLETIPVRIKPVPQTKRMKDKYTADKCAKTARLMLERVAAELLGSDHEVEGVNSDDEEGGKERQTEGSSNAQKAREPGEAAAKPEDGEERTKSAAEAKSNKPPKPLRNMDDWTDEEDARRGKKGRKGTKSKKRQ